MEKQRRLWLLRGAVVAVTVLLALVMVAIWNTYLEPVSGQVPEQLPLPGVAAQMELLQAAVIDVHEAVHATNTIILPDALQVAKNYAPDRVYASDTVTFAITLRNISTVTFGITVTDQLVPQLTLICGSEQVEPEIGISPMCDAQQNAITYTAPISAQTGVTLTFQASVGSTLQAGYNITNTVLVDDGEYSITRTVTLVVAGPSYVYLPLVMRRWPPIPYPPTISITTPDLGGNYTVSWAYGAYPNVPAPTSYVLQESLNVNFAISTFYTFTGSTYINNFTNKPAGLYYYRVRGHNEYGAGEWSSTVTASVNRVYLDHFTDPASGWHTGQDQRYNFWDPSWPGWETVSYINYIDNHYRFYIPLTRHGGGDVDTWWVWPAVEAPLPDAMKPLPQSYCIEARARFISHNQDPGMIWWAHWGIVFGSNENFTDLHTFQINDNSNRAVIRYPYYLYPGNNNLRHWYVYKDGQTNIEHQMVEWAPDGYQFSNIFRNPSYNTIKVVVRGGRADCYVNGVWMTYFHFGPGMPHAKIGLIAGNWEITPQELQVDYFRYDPGCSEAQQ